jgi:hypothetical protein
MTIESNSSPSTVPSTPHNRTTEVPTHPGVTETKETDQNEAEKIANRLAHQANKREQNFDTDNNNLFSK